MTVPLFERRVLTLAACVEADAEQIETWYRCDPIAVLGNRTAQALVAAGAGHDVVGFLLDVLVLERLG